MQKLSDHFYRHEFECRCGCGLNTVDVELIVLLEAIRRRFGGNPVTVTSGHRCRKSNKKSGGASSSKHLIGQAADIVIAGVSPESIAAFIDKVSPDRYGVGTYSAWTHIDVRKRRARWTGKRRKNNGRNLSIF